MPPIKINQTKGNINKDLKVLKCFVKEAHIDTKSPKENRAVPFNVQKFCYYFKAKQSKNDQTAKRQSTCIIILINPPQA